MVTLTLVLSMSRSNCDNPALPYSAVSWFLTVFPRKKSKVANFAFLYKGLSARVFGGCKTLPRTSSQCCYLLLGPLEAWNSAVILQGWITLLSTLGGIRNLQFPWYRMNGSIKPSRGFAVILGFSAFNGSLSTDGSPGLQPKLTHVTCLVVRFA